MNNRAGILYTQLTALEKRVEFLEKNTETALDHFLKLKEEKQTHAAEQRIIMKLWQLDEMQDQMDAIVAELKENGWWASKIAGDAKYIYRQPKVKKVAPPKKNDWIEHKVYSVETKAQEKRRLAKQKAENRRREREELKLRNDAQKAAEAVQRAQEAAERAAEKVARKAAMAARPKPKAEPKPKPKPKPRPKMVRPPKPVKIPKPAPVRQVRIPKNPELVKAERGVYDAILDRDKVDGVFERQRLRDVQWITEAQEALIKYADTPSAQNGHQHRSRARIKLAAAQQRIDTLEERKAERYAELDERLDKYRAEVVRLTAS